MRELELSADALVASLLEISRDEPVCILDSCGVGHLGSHRLIAGLRPVETVEISHPDPEHTLRLLDAKLSGELAGIFTLSYDFGSKLQTIRPDPKGIASSEPDIFLAMFETLIYHDYDLGQTFLVGDERRFDEITSLIHEHAAGETGLDLAERGPRPDVRTNFTKSEYIDAVERIKEHIRAGDTYQANLTQRLECDLPAVTTPQSIFFRLRRAHPAPFAAYLTRPESTVISASPERFFRVTRDGTIEASPIKGTRPRGRTSDEDSQLRAELAASEKDRAENTMIVDLMRNDLGRVCTYGSVAVEKLCDIEEHPTLFHLVSTVSGKLVKDTRISDILRALFPCGSITGAPKIRTMELIGEIEPDDRGLPMGAIGCYLGTSFSDASDALFDLSVAIRTIVVRGSSAVFNVGGGIVIDSEPEKEFDESLLKAKALLEALGASEDALR